MLNQDKFNVKIFSETVVSECYFSNLTQPYQPTFNDNEKGKSFPCPLLFNIYRLKTTLSPVGKLSDLLTFLSETSIQTQSHLFLQINTIGLNGDKV